MSNKIINIGFGNIVLSDRVITVLSPDSAPIKRLVQDSKERGKVVDATYGRKTRSVIITDCDYIVLSAIQPETISQRFDSQKKDKEEKR